MATDYDAPRKSDEEIAAEAAETLAVAQAGKAPAVIDPDEANLGDDLELPGADLSGETLSVLVVPVQADEFTCSRCFLVHHASQLSRQVNGQPPVCVDCE